MASTYTPPESLAAFLQAGPPPIYIGFGSITLDNSKEATTMIFDAIKNTGVRALVSKGWAGLGTGYSEIPENIYMLGDCPHDWLFTKVSCVIHHGGAGTTAIGIALGKPTVVVPFFGDQPFWGGMVFRAGAGPKPVAFKKMTTESLTESIRFALKPETLGRAQELGAQIQDEDGAAEGARQFCAALPADGMRCSILPDRVAIVKGRKFKHKLSSLAAVTLMSAGVIRLQDLQM
jgi:UDP:flavonoid glycosyltransferase YjiC (YdhE family)